MIDSCKGRPPVYLGMLSDLVRKAQKAQRKGAAEAARSQVAFSLFFHWFNDFSRLGKDDPYIKKKLLEQQQDFARLQKQHRENVQLQRSVSADLEKSYREREAGFFTNVLQVKGWGDIAKGQQEATKSVYHRVVRRYLDVPEPLPDDLRAPEIILFPYERVSGDRFGSLVAGYKSASWIEDIHFDWEIANKLYQGHQNAWRDSTPEPAVFNQAAQGWMEDKYEQDASSFLRVCAQEFRRHAQDALTPVLLCHFALWVRKLGLPPKIWKPVCIPAVIRDACHFILEHGWRLDSYKVPFADVTRLIVKGYACLVQSNASGLKLTSLQVLDRKIREVVTAEFCDALAPMLLRWHGGLTALAVLALLQDEATTQQDKDAVTHLVITLLTRRVFLEDDNSKPVGRDSQPLKEVLLRLGTKSAKPYLVPALAGLRSGEISEKPIDRNADYLVALLLTRHCNYIRRSVMYWLQKQFPELRWLKSFDTSLFTFSHVTIGPHRREDIRQFIQTSLMVELDNTRFELMRLVCEFPWDKRNKKRRQVLTNFLINETKSRRRQELQERRKWRNSHKSFGAEMETGEKTVQLGDEHLYRTSPLAQGMCDRQGEAVVENVERVLVTWRRVAREYLTIISSKLNEKERFVLVETVRMRYEALDEKRTIADTEIDERLKPALEAKFGKKIQLPTVRKIRSRADEVIRPQLVRLRFG